MSTQHEMRLPFTRQKEILDWEAYYIQRQPKTRQELEASVIGFRENVLERGFLLESELLEMARWKDRFAPSNIKQNSSEHIEAVTREAFRPGDDWEKLEKLIGKYGGIFGVRESIASVILHLYDREKYPILDRHALRSIGINSEEVEYDKAFWEKYVKFCCTEAERYDVPMRTLDRALYKFSESNADSILNIMPEEKILLELARRGYDLSKLRENDKKASPAGENVKIG